MDYYSGSEKAVIFLRLLVFFLALVMLIVPKVRPKVINLICHEVAVFSFISENPTLPSVSVIRSLDEPAQVFCIWLERYSKKGWWLYWRVGSFIMVPARLHLSHLHTDVFIFCHLSIENFPSFGGNHTRVLISVKVELDSTFMEFLHLFSMLLLLWYSTLILIITCQKSFVPALSQHVFEVHFPFSLVQKR